MMVLTLHEMPSVKRKCCSAIIVPLEVPGMVLENRQRIVAKNGLGL
jgi:hypothetical protein